VGLHCLNYADISESEPIKRLNDDAFIV